MYFKIMSWKWCPRDNEKFQKLVASSVPKTTEAEIANE